MTYTKMAGSFSAHGRETVAAITGSFPTSQETIPVIEDGWGVFRIDEESPGSNYELIAVVDTETLADLLVDSLNGEIHLKLNDSAEGTRGKAATVDTSISLEDDGYCISIVFDGFGHMYGDKSSPGSVVDITNEAGIPKITIWPAIESEYCQVTELSSAKESMRVIH